MEEPRLRSDEEFRVKTFFFFFGNRISSSLRNKPEGYFGKQRTGLGLLWGLKACEIKELRTDWFLKLARRTLGCSEEAGCFGRDGVFVRELIL